MKAFGYTPGSQCMKECSGRISRFIRMILVEELITGICRVSKFVKLCSQSFDLMVIKKAYAGEITVGFVKLQLLGGQSPTIPFPRVRVQRKQIADQLMV